MVEVNTFVLLSEHWHENTSLPQEEIKFTIAVFIVRYYAVDEHSHIRLKSRCIMYAIQCKLPEALISLYFNMFKFIFYTSKCCIKNGFILHNDNFFIKVLFLLLISLLHGNNSVRTGNLMLRHSTFHLIPHFFYWNREMKIILIHSFT